MYVLLAVRVPTYLTEPTLSNLFRPDWWWGIAVLLSVLFIVGAWRRGRLGWSMTSLGLVVGTLGMTAYLVLATGSTWDLMLYYPVKAMWTAMVVLVPLASAGATALVIGVWRVDHGRAAVVSMALRATVVLVVCVTCLGVAGRVSAFPPHLGLMASGRAGMPNWAMAVGSALAEVPVPDYAEKGAIVFGIVPAADISDVKSGFVGMVDYMAMESVSHLGIEDAFDSPVKPALVSRDMTQVCRYLLDHPDSLRITGPNPATGPQWILDAGCPADVVKPDVWISLQFDPVWLDNSPWAGAQWRFPTTAELRGDNSQTTA
jgi:hypothetical protein